MATGSAEAIAVPGESSASTQAVRPSIATFDSLPYFDEEIDRDGVRDQVQALLEAEMRKGAGVQSVEVTRLPPKYSPFSHRPDLLDRLERIGGRGEETKALDTTRFQLAPPEDEKSIEQWERCTRNGEAQLMHSDYRSTNIELMKKYGANDWRLHNFQQEAMLRTLDAARDEVQSNIMSVNRKRKAEHIVAGEELVRLRKRWAELLNRCLSVELANVVAKEEIEHSREVLASLRDELARSQGSK